MTKKPAATKCKPVQAKPPTAAPKFATAKQVSPKHLPEKMALATKQDKKKKDKKANGKTETKVKVVRDSFTMPQKDYAKIGELKQTLLKAGMHVKKSELLRAGLHALDKLDVTKLKQTIAQMEQIKTGRPKKSGN